MNTTDANPRTPLRYRTLILLTALAGIVFSACGGGDALTIASEQQPTVAEEQPDDPTPAPEQDPEPEPEPEDPTPTPEPEPEPFDVAEFCFAAAKVGEAGEILDLIDTDGPDQLEFAFTRMQDAVDAAIPVAPPGGASDILAQAKAEWDPIVNVMDVLSWDLTNAQPETLENLVERGDVIDPLFDRLEEDLVPFLEAECGITADQLVENAEDTYGLFFPPVTLEPTPEPEPEPTPEPVTDDVIEQIDETGSIMVRTPSTWTDSDTRQTDEGVIRFIVAESVQGYTESWGVPGASIAWIPLPGGIDEIEDFDLLQMTDAFSQCLIDTTEPYSDPLYNGLIATFTDCGQSGTNAAVVVARTPELPNGFIGVEVQYPVEDTTSLQTILASFVVNPGT